VAERLKARAWKVRNGDEPFEGSNPSLSAILYDKHLTPRTNLYVLAINPNIYPTAGLETQELSAPTRQ
jgi:hypothetical protein